MLTKQMKGFPKLDLGRKIVIGGALALGFLGRRQNEANKNELSETLGTLSPKTEVTLRARSPPLKGEELEEFREYAKQHNLQLVLRQYGPIGKGSQPTYTYYYIKHGGLPKNKGDKILSE